MQAIEEDVFKLGSREMSSESYSFSVLFLGLEKLKK